MSHDPKTTPAANRLIGWRRWIFVGALIVMALAWWGYRQSAVEIAVYSVARGPVVESIEERGYTRLPEEVEITMPESARVMPIELAVGDRVAEGDIVARLAEPDLNVSLNKSLAAVAELKAALAEAQDEQLELDLKRQAKLSVASTAKLVEAARVRSKESKESLKFVGRILERTRILTQEDVRSEDELDRTEVDYVRQRSQAEQDKFNEDALELLQQAIELLPKVVDDYVNRRRLTAGKVKQQLAAAEAALQETRLLLSRAQMKSPIDGVVLYRATTSEKPLPRGTTLLRIGDLDRLEVQVDVLTEESLRIPPGAEAELLLGADFETREESIQGRVYRIEPEGFTKVSALGIEQQRVWVIIRFDEQSRSRSLLKKIGVGYRVRARITTKERKEVLRIPRTALFRSDLREWQVMCLRGGRLARQVVQVGLQNDRWAEVTSGLEAGEQVVVAPDPKLTIGQRARARQVSAELLDPRSHGRRTSSTRR